MPNMSYCRWQNTASDLQDCLNHLGANLDGAGQNDRAEKNARDRILRIAQEMIEACGGSVEWEDGMGPVIPTEDDFGEDD